MVNNISVYSQLSQVLKTPISNFNDCFDVLSHNPSLISTQSERLHELCDLLKQVFNERRQSLLLFAMLKNRPSLVEVLINNKINIAAKDVKENTAFHIAGKTGFGKYGNGHILSKLSHHIDLAATNARGKTMLFKAIKSSQIDLVQWFINHQSHIDSRIQYFKFVTRKDMFHDAFILTPLEYAIVNEQIECIDVLLDILHKRKTINGNLSLERIQPYNMTFLHLIILFHKNAALLHFIENYTDLCKDALELKDPWGYTPFAYAVLAENITALNMLHKLGANIENPNSDGYRPIHLAALSHNPTIVECLYNLGCHLKMNINMDPNILDIATSDTLPLIRNLLSIEDINNTSAPNFLKNPPQNLVFQGGGSRGIAYIGVFKALNKYNAIKDVIRVAGSSAGAINSVLLAFNFELEEMEELLRKTDMGAFLDHPHIGKTIQEFLGLTIKPENSKDAIESIKNIIKMVTHPKEFILDRFKKLLESLFHFVGLCEGEQFRLWIEGLIRKKTGISYCTFGELRRLIQKSKPFKHLYVTATRINTKPPEIVVFNSEDPQWNNVIISDAVRASMSIPFVFKPHEVHEKKEGKRVKLHNAGQFMDGGIIYNLPLELFDKQKFIRSGISDTIAENTIQNNRTLGFSLQRPGADEVVHKQVNTLIDLCKSLFLIYDGAEGIIRQLSKATFNNRVITINDLNISLLKFNLIRAVQDDLINSGHDAVVKFYHRYNDQDLLSRYVELPHVTSLQTLTPPSSLKSRIEKLNSIKSKLNHSPNLNIFGYQGCGKTELAAMFARKNRLDYSTVWMIPCHDDAEKENSYRQLAKALKVYLHDDDDLNKIIERVHDLLNANQGLPWLLIYDHALGSNTSPVIPTQGGNVIITSRLPIKGLHCLTIEPFIPSLLPSKHVDFSFEDNQSMARNSSLIIQKLSELAPRSYSRVKVLLEKNHLNPIQENKIYRVILTPSGKYLEAAYQALNAVVIHILDGIPACTKLALNTFLSQERSGYLESLVEEAFKQKKLIHITAHSNGSRIDVFSGDNPAASDCKTQ